MGENGNLIPTTSAARAVQRRATQNPITNSIEGTKNLTRNGITYGMAKESAIQNPKTSVAVGSSQNGLQLGL